MDPLLNQNFSLQMHNPLGGSMNFDPLVYGLTQQDIKDSASPTLKTSFTWWNISMTDTLIQDMQNLSKRKYSTIVLPDGMEDRESWLYLNNERMGYWNKPSNTWTAYIDNQGNFLLNNPTILDNSLEWNSVTWELLIQWNITWSTITWSLFRTSDLATRIEISDDEIRWYDSNVLVSTIKPWSFSDGTSTESWVQITGNLSVSWFSNMKTIYIPTGNIDVRDWYIRWVEPWSFASAIYWRKVTRENWFYCVEAKRDLWVGIFEWSNARIYLWSQASYLYNDTWTLHWVDWLGNDWTIDKHL